MLWISPHELWDIGIGVADAKANWSSINEQLFAIAEIDFRPILWERQGNYRVYSWMNSANHVSVHNDADNYGFGFSFDQEITEPILLFARYGHQRDLAETLENAVSAGLQTTGKIIGREEDVLGIAYGTVIVGDVWKDLLFENGVDSANENHLELYYNMKVHDHIQISLDIQWVINPNGDNKSGDIRAFGLRVQISF